MKRAITSIGILFFLNLGSSFAQTQQELTPLEKKQLTVLEEPATLFKGFLRVFVFNTYTRLDKFINEDGNRLYFGNTNGYTLSTTLGMSYGITNRLAVTANIPYTYYSFSGNYRIESSFLEQVLDRSYDRKGGGLSDVQLGALYQLITESPTRPSIRLSLIGTLPTGEKNPTDIVDQDEYKEPLGSGQFKLSFEVQARKIMYPYTFQVYSYYEIRSDGERIPFPGEESTDFTGGDQWGLILTGGMHLNDWLTVNADLQYANNNVAYFPSLSEDQLTSTALSVNPNLTFQIRQFRLFQSMSVLITGTNTATNPAYNFGLAYTF